MSEGAQVGRGVPTAPLEGGNAADGSPEDSPTIRIDAINTAAAGSPRASETAR